LDYDKKSISNKIIITEEIKMKFKRQFLFVLVAIFMAFSVLQVSAEQGPILKQLKSVKLKANIERLTKQQFELRFGDNQAIPRSNQTVLSLAKRLYSKAGREEIKEECGENAYGILFAALSNPDITDTTIDEVGELVDADMPALPSIYTSGHFKFYYTTADPDSDNNVTLAEVQATAVILNNAWNDYVVNFTEPKNYLSGGVKLIDVNVYYLGATLLGSSASYLDSIDLNSKLVVKDTCKRQTTPVHELFHRVEYSYGYITGTANMSWAVEGCASWSQKYRASNVGDWMDRMNQGLNAPDLDLITGRSYNACHYWCYLGQRGTGGYFGGSEKTFINTVWSTYQTNGKNMKNAVDSAIKAIIGASYNFERITTWWQFANFIKDMTNASSTFDYEEDEWIRTCGGTTHGPLAHTPRTTVALNLGTNYTVNGTVSSYGADYYVFNVGATVTRVELTATAATNNFAFAVIEIKNGAYRSYVTTLGGRNGYTYTRDYTPGQVSQIALMVMGNPGGGAYTVNAKGLHASITVTDPNEAAAPDAQDFKQIYLVSNGTNLNSTITFYAPPVFNEFFFYVDTNTSLLGAEICIRCHQNNFQVYQASTPGLHNILLYTGVPSISGSTYSLSIPWTTCFGAADPVYVWLYSMASLDRLQDSGSITVNK
jgi:hypothetical protein